MLSNWLGLVPWFFMLQPPKPFPTADLQPAARELQPAAREFAS